MRRTLASESHPWLGADGKPVLSGLPFGLMGIVNITPDSFYDGGEYFTPASALDHAHTLLEQGADILDIGAESSRPGALPLEPTEELERLELPLKSILDLGATVSVDTWHASTAAKVLDAGVAIINDISACAWDDGLLEVLCHYKPGYVLMHSGARPKDMQKPVAYVNIVEELLGFFSERLNTLVAAGLPEDRIVLDPGIGFGKSPGQNLVLLANIGEFLRFGRPLLMGLSMKSMFGALLGLKPGERGCATAVASALLWEKGVFWHRVHDVGATKNALVLAAALANSEKAATLA